MLRQALSVAPHTTLSDHAAKPHDLIPSAEFLRKQRATPTARRPHRLGTKWRSRRSPRRRCAGHQDDVGANSSQIRGIRHSPPFGKAAELPLYGRIRVNRSPILGVGDDPNVRLPAFDGRAERQGQAADGRFGGSPRPEHVELGSATELGHVELLGQPAVQVRGGPAEVVGQVFLAPGHQVESPVTAAGQPAGLAVPHRQLVAQDPARTAKLVGRQGASDGRCAEGDSWPSSRGPSLAVATLASGATSRVAPLATAT